MPVVSEVTTKQLTATALAEGAIHARNVLSDLREDFEDALNDVEAAEEQAKELHGEIAERRTKLERIRATIRQAEESVAWMEHIFTLHESDRITLRDLRGDES